MPFPQRLSGLLEFHPSSDSGSRAILDSVLFSHHTAHSLANPLAPASKYIQILTCVRHHLHCYQADPDRQLSCPVRLSASIKMKFRSRHFSSHKSPVASQISVSKLAMPLVVQQPLPPPLLLTCSHSGLLAAPITHRGDAVFVPVIPSAWTSPAQTPTWSIPTRLHSEITLRWRLPITPTKIQPTFTAHTLPPPCLIFLYCTYYQRTSCVFLCVSCLSLLW